jgi:beta-galactosidase
MTKKIFFTCFVLAIVVNSIGQTILFNVGWRFHRGGAQSAEMTWFDDSKWRTVDLPHDWSIEDLPGTQSPFDPDAVGQVSTGFTVGGTGWYRKTFTVPAEQKNKRIIIQFDGVYMNSGVWLNSEPVGKHPYGYTSFWFDITDKIKFGEQNIITVQVRNEGQNSRWYTGSGIYRHVWLKMLEPVHVLNGGYRYFSGLRLAERCISYIQPKCHHHINDHAATHCEKRNINKPHSYAAGGNTQFLAQWFTNPKSPHSINCFILFIPAN